MLHVELFGFAMQGDFESGTKFAKKLWGDKLLLLAFR